jgi:GNAT superfamily N-acetyltransferase
VIVTRAVFAAAGMLAAPAVTPNLPAPLASAMPALSAPSIVPLLLPAGAPVPVAAAPDAGPDLAALIERGWIRSGPWLIALREGRNAHGQKILTLDALDAAAPERGTVGHIDFVVQGNGQAAVLDGPLDIKPDLARLPPGAEGADLSHWRQYLWFGFAVTPEWQGRGLGVVLIDLASALSIREGAPQLIIYATESSRSFYLARFEGRVLGDEPFTGADEGKYHRLVVALR